MFLVCWLWGFELYGEFALSIACYRLFVGWCLLRAVRYLLWIGVCCCVVCVGVYVWLCVGCSLFHVRGLSLFVVCCLLFVVCCSLFLCLLRVVRCVLCVEYVAVFVVCYLLQVSS